MQKRQLTGANMTYTINIWR